MTISMTMSRRYFMGATSLATLALLAGCGPDADGAGSKVSPQAEALVRDFFADCDAEDLKRSPMTQTFRGIKDDYSHWDPVTQAYQNETLAINKRRIETLKGFNVASLSPSLALSVAIYQASLERAVAADKFRDDHYAIEHFNGVHQEIPSFLINQHVVTSKADAEAYIRRLYGIDELLNQVMGDMSLKTSKGVFAPRWDYAKTISTSKAVITGAPFEKSDHDSALLEDFKAKVAKLDISGPERDELIAKASGTMVATVLPAYQNLIAKLEMDQAAAPAGDGVWRLPNGPAFYQERLRYYTTTDMTADQVHQLGLDNVARIHKDMEAIKQKVGFEGDLKAFFEHVRNNPALYFPDTEAGRKAYLDAANATVAKIKAKLPDYFGRLPKAELLVKAVEPFREKEAGKAFYEQPSADGRRPGIFYANLSNMKGQPKYEMEALVSHEGLPGHHMQIAIAQELEGVPELQKFLDFTAYTEGWGLYTEELAKEMGLYQDPYSEFGRLSMELLRACRLVVDTGMHAKKWSREDAIKYQAENTAIDEKANASAIERYLVYPGQATAYLIGKLKIMELREKAKAELGEKFDIRGFHDEVLGAGAMPLDLLEKRVGDWVAAQKAA